MHRSASRHRRARARRGLRVVGGLGLVGLLEQQRRRRLGRLSCDAGGGTGRPSTPAPRRRHRRATAGSRSSRSRYPADPGAGAFYVTISGESNALTGYPFPPDNFSTDTYMPDGWEFVILEYIVVVDKVTLWSNPDLSTTDQAQHGAAGRAPRRPVRRRPPQGRQDRRPGRLPRAGDAARRHHEPERQRQRAVRHDRRTPYGFGFSTVPATYDAYNVNLDASEAADFALMVQKGYCVFYRGHGRLEGRRPGQPVRAARRPTRAPGPDAGLVRGRATPAARRTSDGGYDFSRDRPS